jgi:hypothetical protein
MDGEIGDGLGGTVSSNQPARIYHEETNGNHRMNLRTLSQRRRKDRRLWKCETSINLI